MPDPLTTLPHAPRHRFPAARSTTILALRHRGTVVVAGDGQVSLGDSIMKHHARKVRRLHNGRVLAGFAGASADARAQEELRRS